MCGGIMNRFYPVQTIQTLMMMWQHGKYRAEIGSRYQINIGSILVPVRRVTEETWEQEL